ncbi:LamG-like jellyroll fold domain-containing protein [candidate division KSB1 bacterium]
MNRRNILFAFTFCIFISFGFNITFAQLTPPAQTYALRFCNNREVIASDSDSLNIRSEFTMETWIYLDELTEGIIIGRFYEGAPDFNYGLKFTENCTKLEFIQATDQTVSASFIHNIEIQTWTHIAATLSNGTMHLFINAEEVATAVSPGIPSQHPNAAFRIGNSTGGLSGAVAQVRLWNKAMTAAEIQSSAETVLTGNETGLIACWHLDEGSGQTAGDIGPNSIDLTLGTTDQTDSNDPKWVNTVYLSNDPYFTIKKVTPIFQFDTGCLIDFDSDGDLDFITLKFNPEHNASPLYAFTNDGSGNFTESSAEIFENQEIMVTGVNGVNSYAVDDFNGDGLMDVYIGDGGKDAPPYPGGQGRLLIQTNDGHIRDETDTRMPNVLSWSHDLSKGDIDGDGDVDIYEVNISGIGRPIFYINDGNGYFSRDTTRVPMSFYSAFGVGWSTELLDVDNDNDIDIVLGGRESNRDALLLNDGTGYFTPAPADAMPLRNATSQWITIGIAYGDFDNDGWKDLIMYNMPQIWTDQRVQLLMNNGDGTFADKTYNIPQSDETGAELLTVDINNDGLQDFIAPGYQGISTLKLYLSTGQGEFINSEDIFPFLRDYGIVNAYPGDLDKDGDIDLLMMKQHEWIIALNERPFNVDEMQQPVISEFSPVEGPVGTSVTITGTNLKSTVQVEFNGISTDFTIESDTRITAIVPNGTSSGPIFISTPEGVFTTSSYFNVTGPSISTFRPMTGFVSSAVTINGFNFEGAINVKFNDVDAVFTIDAATQITAIVPEGATTGFISITTSDGTIESTLNFTVIPNPPTQTYILGFHTDRIAIAPQDNALNLGSQFTFEAWAYWNINPAFFIIMGRPFPSTDDDPPTSFDKFLKTAPYLLHFESEHHLNFIQTTGAQDAFAHAQAPRLLEKQIWTHVAGSTDGDTLRLYVNGVEVANAPCLGPPPQNIPTPFAVGGGSTPQGGQFDFGLEGYLREVRVWNRALSAAELQENIDKHLTGTEEGLIACWPLDDGAGQTARDIGPNNLTLMLGTSQDSDDNDPVWINTEEFVTQPSITSFFPDSGAAGDTITVIGANFSGVTNVKFNEIDAVFSVISDAKIIAVVPSTGSSGEISVTYSGGIVESYLYFTVTSPTIISFSPTEGPIDTMVVITGSNLLGATSVLFNETEASFSVISNTEIHATVPICATNGSIRILTPDGTAISSSFFTVLITPPMQNYVLHFTDQTNSNTTTSEMLNLGIEFSIQAWVFIEEKVNGRIILLKYGTSDSDLSYILGTDDFSDNLGLGFMESNAQPGSFANAYHNPCDGLQRWAHIAVTLKNDTLLLFVDGEVVATALSQDPTPSGNAQLTLGGFQGKLRHLSLWNRALTGSEHQTYAQQYLTGTENGLAAYWPLDDGSGQTPRDLGPNNIQLTLGLSTAVESVDPVWVATGEPVGVDEEPKVEIPKKFALKQNYPNPFNPETTIKYELPKTSDVSLKIYNILGQEVKTLINQRKPAGYHTIIWDGRNKNGIKVSSGIYICRIKAGHFVSVKKMVMIK